LNVLIMSVYPTPNNLAISVATRENYISRKIASKQLKGLKRPVEYLKMERVD